MTKQDYKNKVMEEFDEKYRESVQTAYPEYAESHNILLSDIKSFLSKSIDEAIELAFRECGVNNPYPMESSQNLAFKHCIDERSKLETKFLEN